MQCLRIGCTASHNKYNCGQLLSVHTLQVCFTKAMHEALHPFRRAAPVPSRCTRSVALHPFRRAAPVPSRRTRSVALHPIRRGVMPTDRVHHLPRQAQPRTLPPHRPQPSASDAATRPRHAHPGSEREALHPLRRETPVTSRNTRYVAMHPIRRGVMPTDRVQHHFATSRTAETRLDSSP